jgi:hypothetical protein
MEDDGRRVAGGIHAVGGEVQRKMSRWPIIRHIRYAWLKWRVLRWYDEWARMGLHAGNMKFDFDQLDRVWRGER